MGGGLQVLLSLWLVLGVCSLIVLGVLYETLLVPVLMYGSETRVWKEKERSRIRAVGEVFFCCLLAFLFFCCRSFHGMMRAHPTVAGSGDVK